LQNDSLWSSSGTGLIVGDDPPSVRGIYSVMTDGSCMAVVKTGVLREPVQQTGAIDRALVQKVAAATEGT